MKTREKNFPASQKIKGGWFVFHENVVPNTIAPPSPENQEIVEKGGNKLKNQNYFIDVKIEVSFNLSRGVIGVSWIFFLKCMRNESLFFQKFSYIWNDPIFLHSSLKIFFLFFPVFLYFVIFFWHILKMRFFLKYLRLRFCGCFGATAAAAAVKNFSRSSSYALDVSISQTNLY